MASNEEQKEDGFIAKVKITGNSLNVTIPVDTCDFCEISDGDLVQFKIIKIKKKKGERK